MSKDTNHDWTHWQCDRCRISVHVGTDPGFLIAGTHEWVCQDCYWRAVGEQERVLSLPEPDETDYTPRCDVCEEHARFLKTGELGELP